VFARIAVGAGYRYGARLPHVIYPAIAPLFFADQDYARPDRAAYMAAVAFHRPNLCTVLDLERADQLPEVLGWAEEAAQYVERVVIIPKCYGIIARLPRRIGGADVVLGYSVPTSYGGTAVPVWEFAGWPVHLLGGSPQAQMWHWRQLSAVADVVSADGNYAQKLAVRHCQTWVPGTGHGAKNRWWPTLTELDGRRWPEPGAPAEAFRRSCLTIMVAWRTLLAVAA
jgi:hypothetical protein